MTVQRCITTGCYLPAYLALYYRFFSGVICMWRCYNWISIYRNTFPCFITPFFLSVSCFTFSFLLYQYCSPPISYSFLCIGLNFKLSVYFEVLISKPNIGCTSECVPSIHFPSSDTISVRSILILSSHILCCLRGSFSVFCVHVCVCFCSTYSAYHNHPGFSSVTVLGFAVS